MAKNPIPIPETSQVSPTPFEQQATEKFKNIDTLIYAVVVAIIVTAISALISVGAIVIDQLHFNNQTYRTQLDHWTSEKMLNDKINSLESKIDQINYRLNEVGQ